MEPMKEFVLWCVQTVPPVLLEPPISAFTGIALLCVTCGFVGRMMDL